MSPFSPSDAALEGFRLTRERPGVVVAWWLAYLAFTLALTLYAFATVGPQTILGASQLDPANTAAAEAAITKMGPFLMLAVPVEVLFFAMLNCAIYRSILRPTEHRFAYFRLGTDEARMAVLAVALFVLWLAAVFLVAMIVGVSAAVLGVFGSAATALLGAAIGFAAVGIAVWAFVRLSLAAPMTFQERRVVVFGSWSLTKGRFWTLFGAYLLAFILGVITAVLIYLVSSAIVAIVVMITSGAGALTRAPIAGVTSIRSFLTFPILLSEAFSAAMMMAFYVINLAPAAIAYQALTAGRPSVSETFA